jgi:hypothetical protein
MKMIRYGKARNSYQADITLTSEEWKLWDWFRTRPTKSGYIRPEPHTPHQAKEVLRAFKKYIKSLRGELNV